MTLPNGLAGLQVRLPDSLSVISNSSRDVATVSQILTNIIMHLRNQPSIQEPCERTICDACCKWKNRPTLALSGQTDRALVKSRFSDCHWWLRRAERAM